MVTDLLDDKARARGMLILKRLAEQRVERLG